MKRRGERIEVGGNRGGRRLKRRWAKNEEKDKTGKWWLLGELERKTRVNRNKGRRRSEGGRG